MMTVIMGARRSVRGVALVMAVCSAACAGPTLAHAQGTLRFQDHGIRLSIPSRSTSTVQRVTAVFGPATTGQFSASSYRVVFRLSDATCAGFPMTRTLSVTTATLDVPLPPNPRDSVAVLAVAWPVRLGIESTDSVFGIRWLQRAGRPAITSGPKCPRPVEVDSFPAANRITALYPWQTRPGGDSIFVTQPALGNGQRPLTGEGFTYTVCQLARNAFTSSVIVWSGPVERCGILAAHWQAGTDPIAPAPDPSPEPGFALDTLNPFQTAGGALRPGIMRVDSVDFEPGRVTILRAAGTGSYMVKVDRSGSGAVVYARLRCPNANDTTPDPHWLVRWNPRLFPDSGGPLVLTGAPGDPNLVYPAPVALAMAAQLPVDSIAELTRRSMASFLDADGPTSNSRYWYDRCFGPRDLH